MGQGTDRVYNLISIVFGIATVIAVITIAAILLSPPSNPDAQVAALPGIIEFPTETPFLTLTPSRTPLPPTFTHTPTETLTPLPSDTPTATITVSPTITDTPAPTDTPTITFTPSASPTFTPTNTPFGPTITFTPTISPYLFDLRENINFVPNFTNTLACAWQGIGGQVLGLDGQPYTGQAQIHVFNDRFDRVVPMGSNSQYGGPTGYEIPVSDSINTEIFFIQLESTFGTQLSPRIQLQFPSDCGRNAAIVNFIQKRSANPVPPTAPGP